MTVLEDAIHAHGGAALRLRFQRFSGRLRLQGALFTRKPKRDDLGDVIVDGFTRQQYLRFTALTAPDRRVIFRPERVTAESLDGVVVGQPILTIDVLDAAFD